MIEDFEVEDGWMPCKLPVYCTMGCKAPHAPHAPAWSRAGLSWACTEHVPKKKKKKKKASSMESVGEGTYTAPQVVVLTVREAAALARQAGKGNIALRIEVEWELYEGDLTGQIALLDLCRQVIATFTNQTTGASR